MNQYTYVRYGTGKYDFHPKPVLIVYGEKLTEADKQFKAITGMDVSKLSWQVGCRWVEVEHVSR